MFICLTNWAWLVGHYIFKDIHILYMTQYIICLMNFKKCCYKSFLLVFHNKKLAHHHTSSSGLHNLDDFLKKWEAHSITVMAWMVGSDFCCLLTDHGCILALLCLSFHNNVDKTRGLSKLRGINMNKWAVKRNNSHL